MAGAVEDTRESTGLIRLAEDYAAEAWGSDRAWFLVNGSTSGVHALLLALCGPGTRLRALQTPTSPLSRAHLHGRICGCTWSWRIGTRSWGDP